MTRNAHAIPRLQRVLDVVESRKTKGIADQGGGYRPRAGSEAPPSDSRRRRGGRSPRRLLRSEHSRDARSESLLCERVRKRASLRRRAGMARAAADALKAHRQGRVRRGSATDLMRDLSR